MVLDLREYIIKAILLLPITTMVAGHLPLINRLLFMIIFWGLMIILVKEKYLKSQILVLFLTCIVYIVAIIKTDFPLFYFNDFFYFGFFVLYDFFFCKNKRQIVHFLRTNERYLRSVLRLWSLIVLISILFSSSYKNGNFISLSGDTFRSTTSATFIMIIVLVACAFYQKSYFIYIFLPLYCVLSGGSRTYLFLGAIIFVISLYTICDNKKQFFCILIPTIAVGIFIVLRSSIMDKIVSSLTVSSSAYYKDPLRQFTSSRSVFWRDDWLAYLNGNIFEKLFGFGFNYVYEINIKSVGAKIYAHNDFLNILLNFGCVGLIIYLYCIKYLFKSCKKISNAKIGKWISFLLLIEWGFNAMFNMFYTYICAVLSYPFSIIAMIIFLEVRSKKMECKRKEG